MYKQLFIYKDVSDENTEDEELIEEYLLLRPLGND